MLYEFDHQHLASLATLPPVVVQTGEVALPQTEESDEQLMARIQSGDEGALKTMMSRHTAILRTVISRVVHGDADTEDTLQDVFIELWNRAHLYDATKGKALGWIITMARRRAIDRVRRRQAYDRAEERMRLQSGDEMEQSRHETVENDANDTDRAEIFQRILVTLPEAQREAVHLAYYCGLSQREIAAKTGIPLGTIKTRLELGVRKVRAAVLAMGDQQEWLTAHA